MSSELRCPKCRAGLRPGYIRCPYCGEWLRQAHPPREVQPTWPARRRRSRAPLVVGIVLGAVVVVAVAVGVVPLIPHGDRRDTHQALTSPRYSMAEEKVVSTLSRCGFEVVEALPETPTPSDAPRITEEGIRIIAAAEEEGRTAALGSLLDGIEFCVETESQVAPLDPDQLGRALLEAAGDVSEDDGPLAFAISRLADEPDGSGRRIGFDASSPLSPVQGVLLQVVLLSVVDEVNGQSATARSNGGVRLAALGRWLGPSVAYAQDWDEEAAYRARAEQILKQKMAVAATGAVVGLGLVAVSVVCPVAAPAALAGLGTVYFTVFATNAALDMQLAMEYRFHREYGTREIARNLGSGAASRHERGLEESLARGEPEQTVHDYYEALKARPHNYDTMRACCTPRFAGEPDDERWIVLGDYTLRDWKVVARDLTDVMDGRAVFTVETWGTVVAPWDPDTETPSPEQRHTQDTVTLVATASRWLIDDISEQEGIPPPRTTQYRDPSDPSVAALSPTNVFGYHVDLLRRAWPGATVEPDPRAEDTWSQSGNWSWYVTLPSGTRFYVEIVFVPDPGQEQVPRSDRTGHLEMGYGPDETHLKWVRLSRLP